jgi:integrase
MLKVFRRHSAECLNGPYGKPGAPVKPGLLADPKLTPEKIRVYSKCSCPCWYSGTWKGRTYPRTALGVDDWKAAQTMLEDMMSSSAQQGAKIKLADALERWHRKNEIAKRAPGTIQHHREVGAMLVEIAGKDAMLTQIDGDVIDELRASWIARGLADSSHRTYLAFLTSFFRFAIQRQEWITKSPMPPKDEWPPKPNYEEREETLPLDPRGGTENYDKILARIMMPVVRGAYGRKPPILRGTPLAALAKVMYWAGLRISDAIMFRPSKLVLDDEIATYTYLPIKTGRNRKSCTTFMPLWLAKELRALPMLSPGYPFYDGGDREQNSQAARKELRRIGETLGIEGVVHPHRFRDSFAVNQLNNGLSIDRLAKLLGHASSTTTEAYYAPWVQSRHDDLRRAVLQSQQPAPANVIPFPKAANE